MRWRRRSPSCEEEAVQQLTRNLRRTLDESIIEAQRKRLAFPRRTPVAQQTAQPVVVTGTRDVNGTAHRPGTNQLTSRERLFDASTRHSRAARANRPRDRAHLLTLQSRQVLNGIQR